MSITDAVAPSGYDELSDVLDNLGLLCREARRTRRLSIYAAGEQIGIEGITLSKIETGKAGTTVAKALLILRWLSAPPDAQPSTSGAESAGEQQG